ncbi:MAG TPA: hypothetical protein VGU43_04585 [Thermoplasmata archaeon]|nr:hypothetical protein [Thermoplasmata archaeon]
MIPNQPSRGLLSRWDRMPRAHRDRLRAYALRSLALLLVFIGAQVAVGAALLEPYTTCSDFNGTTSCYTSGTVLSNLPAAESVAIIGLEIVLFALLALSASAFLLARSVLRQFD